MLLPSLENVPLPIQAHVVSNTVGRIRIRVAEEYRDADMMAQIASALQDFVAEVNKVRINTQTGSLTIYHNLEGRNFETILEQLHQLGIVTSDISGDRSSAAARVSGAMAALNQRFQVATEGTVDLRFLVPLLLAMFALRQLLSKQSPMSKIVPWYSLAWFAFDSFMKFHTAQERSRQDSNP